MRLSAEDSGSVGHLVALVNMAMIFIHIVPSSVVHLAFVTIKEHLSLEDSSVRALSFNVVFRHSAYSFNCCERVE